MYRTHRVIRHYCELGDSSYLHTDFLYMDYMQITIQESDIQMRELTCELGLCEGGDSRFGKDL